MEESGGVEVPLDVSYRRIFGQAKKGFLCSLFIRAITVYGRGEIIEIGA